MTMKRTALGCVLCVVLCAAVPAFAGAAERVSFGKPLVSSDQAALAAGIDGILDQAAALIARLYPGTLEVAPSGDAGTGADYTLSTIASQDKDRLSVVIALTRKADGTKTPTLAWSAPATAELPLWLARAVFLLWSSFHGYLADQAGEPPVFVDDLPGSVLSPTMPPMGIAVTSNGDLAVALIMNALELDHTYRKVGEPAKSLADKGVPLEVTAIPMGGIVGLRTEPGRSSTKTGGSPA